jgi:entry exclusion lipoprotein TrbK
MKRLLALAALTAALLTGCASTPKPTLEDAGRACVAYMILEKDSTRDIANRACEILYEDWGREAFIEEWTSE